MGHVQELDASWFAFHRGRWSLFPPLLVALRTSQVRLGRWRLVRNLTRRILFELSMVVCRALQQVVQSPPSTGKHNRRELYRSMKNLRSEVGFCRVQLILG